MVSSFLVCFAIVAAPSLTRASARPAVHAEVVGKDVILIRSSYNIDTAYLSEQSEWCSYFVDYASTGRQATVLIRTRQNPLRLIVETSTVRGIGMRERHEFTIENPTARTPE
mgnify:CR=1 FL=1